MNSIRLTLINVSFRVSDSNEKAIIWYPLLWMLYTCNGVMSVCVCIGGDVRVCVCVCEVPQYSIEYHFLCVWLFASSHHKFYFFAIHRWWLVIHTFVLIVFDIWHNRVTISWPVYNMNQYRLWLLNTSFFFIVFRPTPIWRFLLLLLFFLMLLSLVISIFLSIPYQFWSFMAIWTITQQSVKFHGFVGVDDKYAV